MKIQENAYVGIEYTLSLDSGETVDQSEPGEVLDFIFGTGQMIPGLERQLEGLEQGTSASLLVEAHEGYGLPDPDMYRDVPRASFPADAEIKAGMVFQAMGPHGSRPIRVKAVEGDAVTVDFNHPLAGERLHFDVKVKEVREATDEDLASMMHGAGCGGGCSCDEGGCSEGGCGEGGCGEGGCEDHDHDGHGRGCCG